MTEKQFEDFIRQAGRDYHVPPTVPREEMWARIERTRRASKDASKVVFFRSPWVRWAAGVAAALVVGIAIGLNVDRLRSGSTPSQMAVMDPAATGEPLGEAAIYQFAALEHLARTEVFLTLFRADVRAGRLDPEEPSPAKELLVTTRLLQGSPASADPRLGELLDDLELVLMQIAQLRAELDGVEAELVTQGIDDKDVLTRLRAAASAAGPRLTSVQGVL